MALFNAYRGLRIRCVVVFCLALGMAALGTPAPVFAADLTIELDQATLVKMPENVTTIVVGNPLIADTSIQAGGLMVVTGKGYGVTNMLMLDRSGSVLMERSIEVRGPTPDTIIVHRGVERESYSCTPMCERRIAPGDSASYFDGILNQTGRRNGQAQAGATVK